jgi:hypothetical protein
MTRSLSVAVRLRLITTYTVLRLMFFHAKGQGGHKGCPSAAKDIEAQAPVASGLRILARTPRYSRAWAAEGCSG